MIQSERKKTKQEHLKMIMVYHAIVGFGISLFYLFQSLTWTHWLLLSLTYTFFFTITSRNLYENLMYTHPAFFEFSVKLRPQYGRYQVWENIISERQRKSRWSACLLVCSSLFPVFFLWKFGYLIIWALIISVAISLYTTLIMRCFSSQCTEVLNLAKQYESEFLHQQFKAANSI